MRGTLAWILGIGLSINGLIMLAAPAAWYGLVPGVPATGSLNAHFVRDIGAAYLVAGAALPWCVVSARARPAAQIGAAFLLLHALVHLADAAAGREHAHALLLDVPTVFVPAPLAVWIAWAAGRPHMSQQGDPR